MKNLIYLGKMLFIALMTIFVGLIYFLFIWLDLILNNAVYELVAKVWSRSILFTSGVKVHIEGADKIDWEKNYVLTGNHLSLMDIPPFLAYTPSRIRFLFKKELGRIPIFGWIINLTHISLDRENPTKAKKSFEDAKKKLKNRTSVIIFPEGTRSVDGEVGEFKKGAFTLSIKNKVDILPYAIYGTRKILPNKSLKINSGEIFISFSNPIKSENLTNLNKNDLVEETRERIIKEYDMLREKYKSRVEKLEN